MKNLKGACMFAQSGGPTSVINASAAGVFIEALAQENITKVYGAAHGIKGILTESFYDMGQEDMAELELLKYTPSSALGSVRYKLKDASVDDTDYKRILEVFKKYDIRYFFYNGGNDSMDTCNKISKFMANSGYECNVIGVPKTIDNDLFGTDHCPGYGSAAKYVSTTVMEVNLDAKVYDTGMVCIIEVMGRNAGWLTAASAYAQAKTGKPHLIYVPERPFVLEDFLAEVRDIYQKEKNCVVALSEGIKDGQGKLISEGNLDAFGHSQLGGVASYLCGVVEDRLGIKTRYIEMSLLQRCAAHLASEVDIEEAMACGREALRFALNGETDKMVSIAVTSRQPYHAEYTVVPLGAVANQVKALDECYLYPENGKIRPDFVDYVKIFVEK